MAGLLAVYAAWQILRWPQVDREMVGDAFFLPVSLVALASMLAASWRCAAQPRLRDAWLLLAAGGLCYLLGDVTQSVYEMQGNLPFPSLADPFYLAFYPLTLLGVLRASGGYAGHSDRVRFGLDLAVVALSAAALTIYVVLGPTLAHGSANSFKTAVSVAYPVGDVILFVAVGSVLLRRTAPYTEAAFVMLAAGLVFFFAADLVYNYMQLHSTYHGGDPVDSLWMIAVALFAVAGALQPALDGVEEFPYSGPRLRASWLPYIALATGFGLLLIVDRHDALLPQGCILIASVAMAALVSIRQFLVQRDLVRAQDALSHQALHDHLTGLANRTAVIERAGGMLARARRSTVPIAALYVDVDGFKHVNDSFGHDCGDALLQTIAGRLSTAIRRSDTVGRLGGDEFVVLLEDGSLDGVAEMIAARICQVLQEPVPLGDERSLSVSASIGIAFGLEGTADRLLRDADVAMYEAKRAGKNCWHTFRSDMRSSAHGQLDLALDLKDALYSGQFFLLYQPVVELDDQRIRGVEALIRWRHPERGEIGPGAFIPAAEENGTIVPIGRWVLHAACAQAADWHARGMPIEVSVNVSAHQLHDERLLGDVAAALAGAKLDPGALILEITETTLMQDTDAATRILHELKKLGVRIAIDDFGTGYSSLAYLHRFPVDLLKIDRSFIVEILTSQAAHVLVSTLIALGSKLGLQTLAEGIEEDEQLRTVQAEHCDFGQGYLFGRPVAPEQIEALLRAQAAPGGPALVSPPGRRPSRPT